MDRFDLGSYSRPVSTRSEAAQRWFDLGLNWCYAFNHEEGIKCFEAALAHDPHCVMAHWGVAYGSGPFYNLVWRDFGPKEAAAATARGHHHLQQARALAPADSAVENGLVAALAMRFQKPHAVAPEEFDRWDDDYAAAMRRLHGEFPHDHDVMALLAEALITRTPRRLWNVRSGEPAAGSDAVEALAVCERSIALSAAAGCTPHPAILHMHIHTVEMSNHPEAAMASADTLATLCPDAGHLNHMPGHIYVLCGDYDRARIVSERAIAAGDKYGGYAGSMNYYVTARCHDIHLMIFTCMLLGRYQAARDAAEKLRMMLTRDILTVQDRPKLAMQAEGYHAMIMHVLVRFGRWQDIIDMPMPGDPALFVFSTPMHHYARGVAYATLKRFADAERERDLFRASLARIPPHRRFLSNPAASILAVGEALLDGELAYHKGNYAVAFAHLRRSVELDDALAFTEPWAWMHPPRHALAALLMEQGGYDEAEQVYRDDLGLSGRVQRCTQHPDNVWALHGLVECLERRGPSDELTRLRIKLAAAQAKADVVIASSCMCRLTTAPPAPGCCC